jgi:hypothetical protein
MQLKGLLVPIVLLAVLQVTAQQAPVKQIQYLSGTGSDKTVAWDFYCTGGRNSGYWTKIQVPSCWEFQGFGSYNYGRDYKTNGKNFRFNDEKGQYKYQFNVPAAWKDKEVFIVFEGSMTDTEVKINGQKAGDLHKGSFYRFKYRITNQLQFGAANLLEATVSKMSADASVNNAERLADYWVFGGIYRPVYLEAVPKEHIDYTAIDAKADGSFAMQVHVQGLLQQRTVRAAIVDAKGKTVATMSGAAGKNDSVVTLQAKLNNVLQWTAETPHLYKVQVSLEQAAKAIYQVTEKFGFRTIEIRRGDGVYLNGVQVKMKGTNRHCFWPSTGRTLNDSIQLMDVRLLKEMNMNAVRCSHYPPDQKFLELCDSMGIYVLDELAGWQKAYSTKAGKPLVKEMILKDLNHPSILFWDNGNEGGTNKELDAEFTRWDFSKRPVIHPHHRPGNEFNGIDCNHYEDYYSTQKILNDSLIYMPTEFLHAQDDGGAGAAMADFWEVHWNAKRSAGGFLWAMLDEAVVRTDLHNVIDGNGVNANDGIMGPYREKEGSFYALREIFSPVKIWQKELPGNFSGTIEVENRFHFTNLNQCSFQWALVNFRKPFDPLSGYIVQQKGMAAVPAIAPLQKGNLSLSLPAGYRNYDALVLVALDPFKQEIYKWTWKVKANAQLLDGLLAETANSRAIQENDSTYVLTGGEVTIALNKKDGLLAGTTNTANDYKLSINNGPVFVQGAGKVTASRQYTEKGNPVVEFTYDGDVQYTRWTVYGSGWVQLDYAYTLNGSYPFAGISFNYPENYVLGAKWLGKGPYRQWKNRLQGTPVNVWENLYNNTQTGYSPLVYPEFKGYYGDITWMELSTVEGKMYVASKDTGLYVRLFDFHGITGPVVSYPTLPAGNISFLDCIPPIGTKLATNIYLNTKTLGPESEPTQMNGTQKRSLYFYFGLPKTSNSKEQYSRPAIDNVF